MKEPEHHETYRTAWTEYRSCLSEQRRKELEQMMDRAQDNFGWDEFQDFKITLPGFMEFWQGAASRALSELQGGIHAGQINMAVDSLIGETKWA
jgi:hypothetical protein